MKTTSKTGTGLGGLPQVARHRLYHRRERWLRWWERLRMREHPRLSSERCRYGGRS